MAKHKSVKSKVKPEDCWKHYLEDVRGNISSIYKTVRLMEIDPMLKFLENSSWRFYKSQNVRAKKYFFLFLLREDDMFAFVATLPTFK